MHTRTDANLAAAEEAHADDPLRADVIHRARRFKASWLELAESLTRVRAERLYETWGHDNFESYAKNELSLRKETADKLTQSFAFLRKRAPEVLSRDGVHTVIPSYQAIDFLRRAEDVAEADRETMATLRKRVLEEGVPVSKVAKEFKDTVFPIDQAAQRARNSASLKSAAMRLKDLLASTDAVTKKLAKEVSTELERLLEALDSASQRAA